MFSVIVPLIESVKSAYSLKTQTIFGIHSFVLTKEGGGDINTRF